MYEPQTKGKLNNFSTHHLVCYTLQQLEPSHEKTNNLGFGPDPTQTGLYSHRRRLEAWAEVEEILYCLCTENKGADQLCSNRTADLRLCFCLSILLVFSCVWKV